MRRSPFAALLPFALSLLAARCASGGAPEPDDFVALEHRWIAALQQRDVKTLDELLDDSFVDSTFRGTTRSKRDVLAGPPAGGGYQSIRLDDMQVRGYGRDTVIVTGVNVLKGAAESDIVRVRFTDVFHKSGGTWRAVAAQETLQTSP